MNILIQSLWASNSKRSPFTPINYTATWNHFASQFSPTNIARPTDDSCKPNLRPEATLFPKFAAPLFHCRIGNIFLLRFNDASRRPDALFRNAPRICHRDTSPSCPKERNSTHNYRIAQRIEITEREWHRPIDLPARIFHNSGHFRNGGLLFVCYSHEIVAGTWESPHNGVIDHSVWELLDCCSNRAASRRPWPANTSVIECIYWILRWMHANSYIYILSFTLLLVEIVGEDS